MENSNLKNKGVPQVITLPTSNYQRWVNEVCQQIIAGGTVRLDDVEYDRSRLAEFLSKMDKSMQIDLRQLYEKYRKDLVDNELQDIITLTKCIENTKNNI